MRKATILGVFLAAVLGLGCSGAHTRRNRLPSFAYPPRTISPTAWSERLPHGFFRTQQPREIQFLLTGERAATPEKAMDLLKAQLKEAISAGGSGDLHYHYYVDGAANLYKGRSDSIEGAPTVQLHTDGVIWVAMLDDSIDLAENDDVRDLLIHLTTYLRFNYEMGEDSIRVVSLTDAGRETPLYRSLKDPAFLQLCDDALAMTQQQSDALPSAPLWNRTQRLRIHQSDE